MRSGVPPTSGTGTLGAHTGADRISWSPDEPPWALASKAPRQSCGQSPAGGRQQRGQTAPVPQKKAQCNRGDRGPGRSMRRGFEHWPLARSARARLIQPRHWQVSWRSGHRREPQHQPCGVLSARSEPWKTSNGCHQQSRPCTRGSQREPHRRAFNPICLQQAWSTLSRGPKTRDTGPCLALWLSLAGCASYAWARPPASECLTWLWQALSSFGIPKQGTRVHHPTALPVRGRGPCVASSPHGLLGPVVRHAGVAIGRGGPRSMHGRELGGHSVRPRQMACATQRRGRSVLGPQTRPHLLQMVGEVAEHGRGDAVRHQVVRPRGRRPYYPAYMVSRKRALADFGACGRPCTVGIAYVPQHRGRSQQPHQAQAEATKG